MICNVPVVKNSTYGTLQPVPVQHSTVPYLSIKIDLIRYASSYVISTMISSLE